VRASNVTIRGLIVQNFPFDGIRVDTQGPSPVVTGVVIDGNTMVRSGSYGIHVTGGIGPGKEMLDAAVINNMVTENAVGGILVSGNRTDFGGLGGNRVTALVDNNTVKKSKLKRGHAVVAFGGDGIDIIGGLGDGSGNSVKATVSNNTVKENRDDGIIAVGCGIGDTGRNNSVDATIINNTVSDNGLNPDLVTNVGIGVSASSREVQSEGGEGSSTCHGNTVRFEISGNTLFDNRTRNISVSGGPGTYHDVQGVVDGNIAKGSREGDGINIAGGTRHRNRGARYHGLEQRSYRECQPRYSDRRWNRNS
jgi:hypothetical protein